MSFGKQLKCNSDSDIRNNSTLRVFHSGIKVNHVEKERGGLGYDIRGTGNLGTTVPAFTRTIYNHREVSITVNGNYKVGEVRN